MKSSSKITILLLGIFIFLSCRQSYKIILGKTFFSENVRQGIRQHSMLDGMAPQSDFFISGVYWQKRIGKENLPTVFHFDRENGIRYAVLAESLAVQKGAWLQLQGRLSNRLLTFGVRGASMSINELEVEHFEISSDLTPFIEMAQKEYHEIRNRLQDSIRLEDSRLTLPADPDWQVFVDEAHEEIIVTMLKSDLMYVAEVDFVFDRKQSKLISVYAHEWFKGE